MFNSQLKRGKFLNEFLVELQIMQIKIWYYFELWFKQEITCRIAYTSWSRGETDVWTDWLFPMKNVDKSWLVPGEKGGTLDNWLLQSSDTGKYSDKSYTLQLNFSEGQLSHIFYSNLLKPSNWALNTNPPPFWGTPYDVRFGMGLYIHNGGVPALKLCSVCCLPVMI